MPMDPAEIVDFLRRSAGRPLKPGELASGLGVAARDYPAFEAQLELLEEQGVLYRVQRQRYAVPERINLAVGRISTTRRGAGFLIPDDQATDIFIPPDALGTANDGDRAVVRVERRPRGERAQGRVIKILKRRRETIVGTFHSRRGPAGAYGFVVPEDRKFRWDVIIPAGQTGAADEGEVVVVRITDWGGPSRGPAGEVERVLGRLGDPGVDVLAIIHGHELPTDFAPEVEAEAERLRARGITGADHADRDDLRALLVFTIDPADARDHDDALSIRQLETDRWEVGVHIADVSHYVREGGLLDREAFARGTSTYLVDRVIPMLPHALSSDLCSLRPDEDRLALSLLLELNAAGDVQAHRLARSVIRSRHKLSYEDAQAILDGGAGPDEATTTALNRLLTISRTLRQRRQARGSLDFDLPEARVVLDTEGAPTDIQRRERLEAHRLIEDFMLLANETIAQAATQRRMPFVYRIHEKPDEAKLEQLRDFTASLGYRLGKATPRDLQRLIEQSQQRPDGALISTVVLRSMKQARYHAANLGHFGLAARHYTHFTSPIRRYPDLVVHRLTGRVFIDREPPGIGNDALTEIAEQSSERERAAVAAERDSIDLKKVEFMERHIGDAFDGSIAGVTSFGLFVLLDDFFVEGLVHVSSLGDDYYLFLEDQYALVGENSGRRFRIGDRVRVRVASVNLEERQIDFLLDEPPARRGGRQTTGGKGAGARRPRGGKPGAEPGRKPGAKPGEKPGRKPSGKPGGKPAGKRGAGGVAPRSGGRRKRS
ncbi:MAG TPA: ribonuclease R [Longimicrobiales bacterium]|nr:ribonuclease R [Longimicrobiales bacterium]